MVTDERLKEIAESGCLCTGCEPNLVSDEVRPIAQELLDLRRMRDRLHQWAEQLSAARISSDHGGVGPFIAAELRNRMSDDNQAFLAGCKEAE